MMEAVILGLYALANLPIFIFIFDIPKITQFGLIGVINQYILSLWNKSKNRNIYFDITMNNVHVMHIRNCINNTHNP